MYDHLSLGWLFVVQAHTPKTLCKCAPSKRRNFFKYKLYSAYVRGMKRGMTSTTPAVSSPALRQCFTPRCTHLYKLRDRYNSLFPTARFHRNLSSWYARKRTWFRRGWQTFCFLFFGGKNTRKTLCRRSKPALAHSRYCSATKSITDAVHPDAHGYDIFYCCFVLLSTYR